MSESPSSSPDDLIAWQQDQWNQGHHVSIEELIRKNQWLLEQPEALLDLIYSEVLLREDAGETPVEDDYSSRFPKLVQQISRQFQVHRALAETAGERHGTAENRGVLPSSAPTEKDGIASETKNFADGVQPTGHPASNRSVDASAPEIPGFSIIDLAGRGGSGVAYQAIDTKLSRIVALKLLDASVQKDPKRSQLLIREAQSAASLIHPNIVQILQVGETGGTPFLVMEFMEGGSLADRLKSGPLPFSEAADVCLQVANAVSFAHRGNVIHRDLKPGNILLDKNGTPKVCDFGLARRLDADESIHVTGDIVGTPAYMPPEQARGEHVDERADVYAIGTVLYELLSGRPPFQAATPWEILHQVLTSDVVPLRRMNPLIPADLETICGKCLQKDRTQRYSTAQEVFQELQRFQQSKPILARPIGWPGRLWKWIRRNPALAGLITVILSSLLTVTLISLLSQRKISSALKDTQDALEETETQRKVAEDALRDAKEQRTVAEKASERAEQQRQVAIRAMNDLVHKVHDDLQSREASVDARGEVLQSAIAGLEKIRADAGDDEATRITLATALTRYGYILTQQGRNEDAEIEYLKSIDVADSLTSADGLRQRAQNYSNIALFYVRAAKFDLVAEWADKAMLLADELIAQTPDDMDMLNVKVQALTNKATAVSVVQGSIASLEIRKQSRDLNLQILESHPDETKVVDQLIDVTLQLIQECITLQRMAEAREYVDSSLKVMASQKPEKTEDVQIKRRYVSLLRFDAVLRFSETDYEAAISSIEKAVAIYGRLAEIEPNRPGFHLRVGTMYDVWADCCLALNQLDDAKKYNEKAIEAIHEGMRVGGPTYAIQAFASMQSYIKLHYIACRQADTKGAAEMLRMAAAELDPILDQYNTRDVHKEIVLVADLLAAVSGLESTSQAMEVDLLKRTFEAWTKLFNGDASGFSELSPQLHADVMNAGSDALKSLMHGILVCSHAQYYALLQKASADPAQLEAAESQTIQQLRDYFKGPSPDLQTHIRFPEFSALRESPKFRSEFGLPMNK